MRCHEFLDSPELYRDGIEVDDMVQGTIGNCWWCKVVAACATREELIRRLFYPQTYSECGV